MENAAKLIAAISQLLWPLLVFYLALRYHRAILAGFRRLRKGKFAGQEFELAEDVQELNRLEAKTTRYFRRRRSKAGLRNNTPTTGAS
jgi:hypothetical protein